MEHALTPPLEGTFLEAIKRNFCALSGAWEDFIAQHAQKKEAQQKLVVFFQSISNISGFFSELERLFRQGLCTPTAFQYEIALVWMIRDIQLHISLLRFKAEHEKILTGSQFKQLKGQVRAFEAATRKFDRLLAEKIQFPLDIAYPLIFVDTHMLSAPLRIFIDDDDTGKHVSCFEIPQIYGFGETADEAVRMLNREILSMYADLCEDSPVSSEYEALKCFLDLVLCHEKQ